MSDDVLTKPAVDADGETIYQQPITAKALRNTFHFWKFFVMGLLVFGFGGIAFLYDGFVRYPRINRDLAQVEAEITALEKDGKPIDVIAPLKTKRDNIGKHHDDLSLMLQRGIGLVCAPLGAWMLFRHLRATSGKYRLENNILSIPRYKPIPIDSVTAIRNAKWMTKGLATFDYKTPEGDAGTFTLDALAYESKPSDAIHDEIVRNLRLRTGADVKTAKELKKD